MIRHITLYTLSRKAHAEGIDKVVEKLDCSAKGMVGKVAGLLHAEVAFNMVSGAERDLLFYSEFEQADDIPPYLESEAHRAHALMADCYVENKETVDVQA